MGLECKIQELNREIEIQKKYVAEGKSKTLNSRHIDKLAVDLILFRAGTPDFIPESYRPLGIYWESVGGHWGGRFGVETKDFDTKIGWDYDHFEFTK